MIGYLIAGITILGFGILLSSDKRETKLPKKAIVIGDSQTPFIAMNSEAKTLGPASEANLWMGGKTVPWLLTALQKYPINDTVTSVVICIGTNDGYRFSLYISDLARLIKVKFPNAKMFVVQGSWGWGGVSDITEQQVKNYYEIFAKSGFTVIYPPIGKVQDPHSNLPIYSVIGKQINRVIQ
jgi:hypothetical protein